ncbi:site-specific integrase [Sphaerospermopsis aphanizomenoides BCCUSP55]|uniref:site-specific integrase n=1 Tax=Sphaerospermopsis aphanizomenoides TaxID=459663 RepID=UPI001908C7F7|nr:site-specific integrase [Sphaerospermopsis aphanizomenoides]MBK1987265.1 site-specific integrase [Sphaerospermopsis aphanizomenoides BCCUSP55]
MDINQRIKEANGRLRAINCGVSIERVGGRLYLRAILPPKPNSGKYIHHQQRISISAANNDGVKIAEKEAKNLSTRIDERTFDWADYIEIEQPAPKTIEEWVNRFEDYYFARRARNHKSETTWRKDYVEVFKKLDSSSTLSPEALKTAILETEPDTRTRRRFCLAISALTKFAKLEFDAKLYSGNYSPKRRRPRDLPTDKEIAEWFYKIKNHKWRWVYGLIATYGLRNHEAFFIDVEYLRKRNQMLIILEGKTGYREVWPLHPEWFEEFDLASIKMPGIRTDRSNSAIGNTVSQFFGRNARLPFGIYDLRHCWAIRSLAYGIDISLAAQQMGHSLHVHSTLYHSWISRRYHQQAFDSAMSRRDRPKPPKIQKG